MVHGFFIGGKLLFPLAASVFSDNDFKKLNVRSSPYYHTLVLKMYMHRTICSTISSNIYRTLQEHQQASQELEKIKGSGRSLAYLGRQLNQQQGPFSFPKTVYQLN